MEKSGTAALAGVVGGFRTRRAAGMHFAGVHFSGVHFADEIDGTAIQHSRVERIFFRERLERLRRIERNRFRPALGQQQRRQRVADVVFLPALEKVEPYPVDVPDGWNLEDLQSNHSMYGAVRASEKAIAVPL